MLQGKNIQVSIAGREIVRGVDVELLPGEVTVLLGPNGCGKSTLLKSLCGELPLAGGEVLLNNRHLDEWQRNERARQLAVLPQRSTLNFPFAVEDVVMMGRMPHKTGIERDRIIVRKVLDAVDGSHLCGQLYTELSGGEQQRVQLARVLVQLWQDDTADNRVLLLDEPSASFDLCHREMLIRVLAELAGKGFAILLVVHDLNLASQCASQLLLMKNGQVVAGGTTEEVFRKDILEQVFDASVQLLVNPLTGKPVVIS